jgi:1-acyl-sn-glycerol-3-phosphate acyltransferase
MRWLFTIVNWFILCLNTALFFPVVFLASLMDANGALAHRTIRLWSMNNLRAGLFCWKTSVPADLDRRRPYVIVSNHRSFFDIPVLAGLLPLQFKFVSRSEVFLVPVLGWCMRFARYISLDRRNPRRAARTVIQSGKWLERGFSLLMFPEGTRSEKGRLGPFHPGAFRLALKTKTPILPVTLVGTHHAIPRHTLWIVPTRFVIVVGRPIETADLAAAALPLLMERVRSEMAENIEAYASFTGPRFTLDFRKAEPMQTEKRIP